MRFILNFTLVFLCFSFNKSANAVDVNVKITGDIYIPTCTINDNVQVNISFGKILNSNINGTDNHKTRTLKIQCDYYTSNPYIKVVGSVLTDAPNNVLRTESGPNNGKLGIALYQGEGKTVTPLTIGNGINGLGFPITDGLTSEGNSFTFTAIPYSLGDNRKLVGGAFQASATMEIYYL